jgi:hypothetical protein
MPLGKVHSECGKRAGQRTAHRTPVDEAVDQNDLHRTRGSRALLPCAALPLSSRTSPSCPASSGATAPRSVDAHELVIVNTIGSTWRKLIEIRREHPRNVKCCAGVPPG